MHKFWSSCKLEVWRREEKWNYLHLSNESRHCFEGFVRSLVLYNTENHTQVPPRLCQMCFSWSGRPNVEILKTRYLLQNMKTIDLLRSKRGLKIQDVVSYFEHLCSKPKGVSVYEGTLVRSPRFHVSAQAVAESVRKAGRVFTARRVVINKASNSR